MPVTININNLSLCHKASGGMSMATNPDVCKTPSPGGPVPIPYPNIAMESDLAKGTTTIKADGGNMCANYGSEFSKSTGDEAGTVGGVVSSTFIKEATWITYSFDVKLEGRGACRLTDKMFHNHQNTVNCGGDIHAPVTVGKVDAATKACEEAAKGRNKQPGENPYQQSYSNCGVESARQIVNSATGANISEDDLLDWALKSGDAELEPTRVESGATTPKGQSHILDSHGVPSSKHWQSMGGIEEAVEEGRGVVVSVDAGRLWGTADSGGHAVVVTGVVKDADGQVTDVIINDTGASKDNCGKKIPVKQFKDALYWGPQGMVVTDKPIW